MRLGSGPSLFRMRFDSLFVVVVAAAAVFLSSQQAAAQIPFDQPCPQLGVVQDFNVHRVIGSIRK